MRTMNVKPKKMFCYQFTDCLQNMGIFLLVMILVMCFIPVLVSISASTDAQIHFSAYTMASAIFILVYGAVSIREALRLGIQHGRGRQSTFLALFLSMCCVSFLLAFAGQLLSLLGSTLWNGRMGIVYTDFYQLLYLSDPEGALSFWQYIEAFFCNQTLAWFAFWVGVFFSLVFLRLDKRWRLVVCVGAPVSFCVLLPGFFTVLPADSVLFRMFRAFGAWFSASPSGWILFFLGASILLVVLDWLLCRRVPITAATK